MDNKVQTGEMVGCLGFVLKYFSKKWKKRKKIREGTHSMNVVKSELCRWVAGGANADAEAESEDRCFWRVIPVKGKEGGSRISRGKPVGRANTSPLWGKREEVTMVKIWWCWLIQWVSFHWLLELSPRGSVLAHWLETAPEQEDLGMGTGARPPKCCVWRHCWSPA